MLSILVYLSATTTVQLKRGRWIEAPDSADSALVQDRLNHRCPKLPLVGWLIEGLVVARFCNR